jgi:hypothetical protein
MPQTGQRAGIRAAAARMLHRPRSFAVAFLMQSVDDKKRRKLEKRVSPPALA